MKTEHTECSETSAYKIHTPGNYPEESIQHSEQATKFEIKKYTDNLRKGDLAFHRFLLKDWSLHII